MKTFTIPRKQEPAGSADDFGEDHRRMLDMVNTLLQAVSDGNKTRVLMACSRLRVASTEHFAREEAQMRAMRYPETQSHCASHERLLSSLSSAQFMLTNVQGFASGTGPMAFLTNWLDAHVATDDRRLAEFVARPAPPRVSLAA